MPATLNIGSLQAVEIGWVEAHAIIDPDLNPNARNQKADLTTLNSRFYGRSPSPRYS